MASPLRIAMVGQKGLPATWGGVEHHVEALGALLAQRGHEVLVYCRPHYTGDDGEREHRGMRLVPVRSVGTKHLDAISHSAASTVRALRDRVDVVHYHAVGPGLVAPLPRYLSRAGVALTVHGLDGERAKWSPVAKAVLTSAERLSARVPDATVVVSRALQEHYRTVHGRDTVFIPNGVHRPDAVDVERVRAFGLEPGRYLLFVGRFVPEKCPDLLLRAFAGVRTDLRLVLAGGSSFTAGYTDDVLAAAAADPRVLVPGYVFGTELSALYAGAAAFVLPSALEGLPLTLLEALAHGAPVVASAIPPHVEVLGSSRPGRRLVPPGDVESLREALQTVVDDAPQERRSAAGDVEQLLSPYRWDSAVEQLEDVYRRIAPARRRPLVTAGR